MNEAEQPGLFAQDEAPEFAPEEAPRAASAALTKASGFLCSFTHSLQPYIGCRFGCSYCYVQGLPLHRFHTPAVAWGDYVHPRTGIDVRLRRELVRMQARGGLADLRIFMSSATDPYQPIERKWRLTRACLAVFGELTPGLLLIQTRSPLVRDDFARIARLGNAAWLSVTIETDREDVRRMLTPKCPSIAQRLDLVRNALALGLQVQVAVSPCLPYSSVEAFGGLLAGLGARIVVDSFASGDGQHGVRTRATAIPDLYARNDLGEWCSEEHARALFAWLHERMGERMGEHVGWSQEGFLPMPVVSMPVHAR